MTEPRALPGLRDLAEKHGWSTSVATRVGEKNGKEVELTVLRLSKNGTQIAACWHNGRWDAAVCKDPLKAFNQGGLKEVLTGQAPLTAPDLRGPVDNIAENIRWERELLGCHVSGDPLQLTTVDLSQARDDTSVVRGGGDGQRIELIGLVMDAEVSTTKRGTLWARFTVEDLSGRCRAFCFGDLADGAVSGVLARLEGIVASRDGEPELKVQKAQLLEEW